MAQNSYLGMDPKERERQALYSASDRVGQPAQRNSAQPYSATQSPQAAQRPLSGGLSGLNSGGTSFQPGMGPTYGMMAANTGAQIAGSQATRALTHGGVSAVTGSTAPAWASGAAGMGLGVGINMAGNAIAERHRVKEDQETFGNNDEWYGLMGQYGRRHEGTGGGLRHGAELGATYGSNPALLAATGGISAGVGALAGLATAAATKNAPSAYTDYSAGDAARGIQDAYRQYLGREASDDEVMGHLRGQGFNQGRGDRWVGEKGLYGVLGAVRDSPEAAAYAQQQAGGAATPGVPTALSPNPGAAPTSGSPSIASSPGQSYNSFSSAGMPDGINEDGSGGIAGFPAGGGGMVNNEAPGANPTGGTVTPSASDSAPIPPPDAAGWDTDGYGAPASIAQGFNTTPPPGWEKDKWNDPNHQTPKYVWGRITQDSDPDDIGQMMRAYPGAQFDGKDKITGIPGLGPIDVYQGASQGGKTPQWLDINAQAAEGGGGQGGGMGVPMSQGASDMARMLANGGNEAQGGWNSDAYANLVTQYLLQGLGLDRAAARLG